MTDKPEFRGLFPAPSVPFDADFNIVDREFEKLISQIANAPGVNGVLVNGHAGELATLSTSERASILELTRATLQDGQKIISGVDGLSVPDAVRTLKDAKAAGADAALVLPPFDYSPRRKMVASWEAPYRFYESLAESVDLPLIIYQFPEPSGVAYTTETLVKLAEIDNVVAVKDTTIDGQMYQEHLEALTGKITILTALDTPDLLGHMLLGCDGAIIGVGQLGPELWGEYVLHILADERAEAVEVFKQHLLPLLTHIFFGRFATLASDSAKAKEALVQMGTFTNSAVRPPEVGVGDADRANVQEGLRRAGLLPGSTS